MFVAIVRFPPISPEKDTEFRKWFSWSNQLLKNSPGFISRKLIRGGDGSYVAIVEYSGYDMFTAMHSSNDHKLVHEKALSVFNGSPKPEFFDVVST
jgi:heme-degrading monooxygenase HmoA